MGDGWKSVAHYPLMARKRPVAVQQGLGLVASPLKPLTPSQRELVRRAGTHLSIQQQQTARRQARTEEAEAMKQLDEELRAIDVMREAMEKAGIPMPKLGRMR